MYVCVFACLNLDMCVCTHLCERVFACVKMCVFVFVYVCVCKKKCVCVSEDEQKVDKGS